MYRLLNILPDEVVWHGIGPRHEERIVEVDYVAGK